MTLMQRLDINDDNCIYCFIHQHFPLYHAIYNSIPTMPVLTFAVCLIFYSYQPIILLFTLFTAIGKKGYI